MSTTGAAPRAREYAGAWLVLAALLALAFWPLAFFGQSIASADPLRASDALYAGTSPQPMRVPAAVQRAFEAIRHPLVEVGIYDPAFYWIDLPNTTLDRAAFRRGEWPLWNPYVGLGTPLLGTGQTGAFFPLKLLLYLGPLLETYSLYLVSRLFLAGAFAYAFARRAGFHHWPSLTGATAYMLGGFLVTHFHNVEAATAALLPLLLWAFEQLARRHDAPSAAVTGMAIALLGTAGHPEPAIHGALAGGWYFLARSAGLRRAAAAKQGSLPRDLALLLGVAALGAACAALVVIPFLERASLAAGGVLTRADPPTLASAMHRVFLPLALHTLLPVSWPQAHFNPYAGPAALLLAIAAIRAPWPDSERRGAVRALLVMAALTLAVFLVSRDSELLPVLPFAVHAYYAIPPLAFALSLLAAAGLEALADAAALSWRAILRLLAPGAAFVLASALAIWDAAGDADRPPGILAFAPALLLAAWAALVAARAARNRLAGRRLPDVLPGAWPSGRVEAASAAAGAALMAGALLLQVGHVAYGDWIGQAVRGTASAASAASGASVAPGVPTTPAASATPGAEPWTARGWLATGEWQMSRAGRNALLFLGGGRAPSLEWFGDDRRIPLSRADVTPPGPGGTLTFEAGGERYQGQVSGGFHHFVSRPAAARLLVELGVGATTLVSLAALARRLIPATTHRVLGVGAFLLTAAPLVLLAATRNPAQPHFAFALPPAQVAVSLLAASPFSRVAPVGHDLLIPNTNVLLGIRSASLQDPLQSCRYQQVMAALGTNSPSNATPQCLGQHQTDLSRLSARALYPLGASLALVPAGETPAAQLGQTGIRRVEAGGSAHAFAADPPAARVSLPTAARSFVRDDPAVLAQLSDPALDLRDTVLVETDTPEQQRLPRALGPAPRCTTSHPAVAAALRAASTPAPTGTARIVEETGDLVRIAVSTIRDSFLVLADSDYPGWTAALDGAPAPICRANGLTRAVPVPAGDHEIAFRYAPASFAAGLSLSLAGYSLVGALLAHGAVRVRSQRSPRDRLRLLRDPVVVIGAALLALQIVVLLGFWVGLPG